MSVITQSKTIQYVFGLFHRVCYSYCICEIYPVIEMNDVVQGSSPNILNNYVYFFISSCICVMVKIWLFYFHVDHFEFINTFVSHTLCASILNLMTSCRLPAFVLIVVSVPG